MSKNLTRKGLALGAVIALGSSLFAGSAYAAPSESAKVTLAPSAGTTYTTLIGASFDLKTELDPTLKTIDSKTLSELTYIVTNPSAQKIKIDLDGVNGADFGDVKFQTADAAADMTAYLANTADAVDFTTKKAIAVTASTSPATNSQSADAADVGTGANTLRLTTSTDSTEPFSVTVQAFIDDNNNGIIDGFEYTSPVRTLNFIKASTATVTTAVTSAVIGTSKLQGTVVIGNDVNNKSLVGQISIGFFKNGSAFKLKKTSTTVSYDTVDVSWDSTDSILTNSQFNTVASQDGTEIIAAAQYTAKAYFGVARSVLGSESSAVSPVAGAYASADYTDELKATASTSVIKVSDTATTVKAGYTGDITFTSYVTTVDNSDADALKTAGVTVKVTLSKGTTFTAGHEITAGGVTLTSTSGDKSFTTTTDAAGKIVVTAKSNKGLKDDIFNIKVQVLTDTAGYETGDSNAVTFAAATVQSLDTTDLTGTNAVTQIAKGGSLALNFTVVDNFGAVSAVAGTYRISVDATEVTGGAVITGTAPVSSGKATFTVNDNSLSATGGYTLTFRLEKLNDAGTAYATVAGASKAVTVKVGTAAVTAITVPADTAAGSEIALSSKDFVSHDLRLDTNTKTYAGVGLSGGFTVSGTATSASGAVVPGALVTISGAGLQFVAQNGSNDNALLTTESITLRANASGAYSVVAHSHVAGDAKITVVSGSATKTVTAKFAYPTTADKDTKIAITGAINLKAGRTSSYVVSLTDKWGNAIKGAISIDVVQDGAGYLTSIPATVSATTGKARLNLITQPADAGLTTLTVTYDVAGTTTDVVLSKNVLVGISAVITKSATSKVTVKNANGLTVKVVRGTKSVTKEATSDKFAVSLKGGTGSVKVYVEDILVASK